MLAPKELAAALGRSLRYIQYMKKLGFEMPGNRATIKEAREFLKKHPNPCWEAEIIAKNS